MHRGGVLDWKLCIRCKDGYKTVTPIILTFTQAEFNLSFPVSSLPLHPPPYVTLVDRRDQIISDMRQVLVSIRYQNPE